MTVTSIPPELVDRYWPDVRQFVIAALDHSENEITEDQLREKVVGKKAQLWAISNPDTLNGNENFVGAAVTEVMTYPNKRALRIVTLSGQKMSAWMEELDKIMQRFARFTKSSHIEAVGRHGFVRRLKPLGYKPTYTVLVKEVSNE